MSADFTTRRRAVLVFYRRYLEADRAFRLAQQEAMSWLRTGDHPTVPPIGHPGSRLRRLHDQRDRALTLLVAAQNKLHVIRQRTAHRRPVAAIAYYETGN